LSTPELAAAKPESFEVLVAAGHCVCASGGFERSELDGETAAPRRFEQIRRVFVETG
jgi:hypothetical protein